MFSQEVIRAVLGQVLVDSPNLDELADHLFVGLRDYLKTTGDLAALLKDREAMHVTHRKELEFNQGEIDTVRSNCSHLITERTSHGVFGRTVCVACGLEVTDVQG